MESVLFNDLLEHLRIHQDDNKIEYREKPVKITKGLATNKYVFTLNNAPEHLAQPLVVRIFSAREAKVQNAVHDMRYPTSRVFFACSDKTVLGREFTIMEYKKGLNLSATGRPDVPEMIGRLYARACAPCSRMGSR